MLVRFARCLLVGMIGSWALPEVQAGTSNSLMDVSPAGSQLLVANSDNGTVSVVDTAARKVLREIKVGDKPEGVTWIGAGPLAAATVYRDDLVVFFDTRDGRIIKKLPVADEPYGIVANKNGTRAWVTQDYPGSVTEVDLRTQTITRQMPAGSFVRGIALAPDESRLYVTEFYTGILHAVDVRTGKVVDSWKGHSTENLSRHVVLHPRRPKAYLSLLRARVEVNHGNGSIVPVLAVCDLAPKEGARRRGIMLDTYNGFDVEYLKY